MFKIRRFLAVRCFFLVGLFGLWLSFGVDSMAQQGVQVNLSPASGQDIMGDAGNEPTLAISPINPNSIVIGWRDFPTIQSDARKAGYAWSVDGGQTFVPGGALPPPPGYSASAEQTDPVVAVDSLGVFTYLSEVFVPQFDMHIYQSFDGGVSWPTVVAVENPVTSGDKGWLTIDRSGGLGDGHLYAGWNNFSLGGQCFIRSVDGGQSFSPAVRIADAGGTQWMLQYAVGPDGELYAAWRNYVDDAIYVTKSLNANDPNVVPTFDVFGGGGFNGLDLKIDDSNDPGFLDINPVGFHQIYLDVDRTNGPRRGWVYCLWADNRNDESDLMLARSMDGGFTWDTGIRVHDDGLGNNVYQWMPAMSVAPNGRIDVVWYDTRNDPGNTDPLSELYYTFSVDGGDSWSVDRRASDAFDTTVGWPSQDKIGDYIQGVSSNTDMNVAYAATFKGGQDIYFLRLAPTLLTVNRLIAGQTAVVDVIGGRANAPIWLLASLSGPGSVYIPALNATAGLANPVQVGGMQMTDANGRAGWNIPVPGGTSGIQVWVQAIQVENGSNRVTDIIQ